MNLFEGMCKNPLDKIGLYLFLNDKELQYIGRCLDSYKKRLNQGYGKIYPKNCYLDGQATNSHLNSLIAENYASIGFYVCPMSDESEIKALEKQLLRKYHPDGIYHANKPPPLVQLLNS